MIVTLQDHIVWPPANPYLLLIFCSGRFVASLTVLYRVPCALFILPVKAITLICVYLNNTHCHMERDLETSKGFVQQKKHF